MTTRQTHSIPDRVGRRGAVALIAVACLALSVPARAAAWDLESLMHELATRKAGRARFVETKQLAMLYAPLESSGTLRFAAPDFLEIRTLKPKPQTVAVRGGQITIDADGTSRQFSLADHPEAAALIDGIRATLNGDIAGLRRVYTTSFTGSRRLWTLKLVPRLAAARAQVSEIDISGSGASVLSIVIEQADGDRSLMTIHEVGPR
ncbi:hypothetical protein GALL_282390 [mine drainage metagenome]|jgi:hypothetical protein|uniref:Lipoprotein chaperone n=1 Tax=mine drainage metagenome TaxID=410659 RepID=A0A1J5RCM0_9ZZZZ